MTGYLTPPPGAVLLPVECAEHARARARVLAEGAAAVAQLESWRDRDRAAATRTRMRNEALAAAAGGGAARALTRGAGETPTSFRESDRHTGHHDVTGGSHNAADTPADTVPGNGVGDHQIDAEQGFDGLPDSDDRESTEKVIPAVEGRRLAGLRTRYRIAEHMAAHPDHTASQIAEALGLGESTVYRHKREIEADTGGEE